MSKVIEICVYGTPGPKGSKRHVGRGIMIESSAKVKPWAEAVKWAVIEARKSGPVRIDGPVHIDVVFTMPRPKSARKGARPFHKPDIDKLLRGTFDPLKEMGVYDDDARIVEIGRAAKVFPNSDPDAIDQPGARIRLKEAA